MNAMVEAYPAFLYRPRMIEDCLASDEQPRASKWSRVMQALSSIRSEVMELFNRGKAMSNGQARVHQAAQAALGALGAGATQQALDEKGEAEAIIKAIDRYRRLNGERYVNHLLRNLLQQSNHQMRDLGAVVADDQRAADAEIQARKAQAAAAEASEYANHFASVLRSIQGDASDDRTAQKARKALEWRPGQNAQDDLEKALAAQAATAAAPSLN